MGGMLFGNVGSSNQVWWKTLVAYSCAEYTTRLATLSWTGKFWTPMRLPPHQPDTPLNDWMPSTKMSRFEFTDSTALPARCAANRQSVVVSPEPQVAGSCGSLCRSNPTTAGLLLYRLASVCRLLIHVDSETELVYHNALCALESGRCRSRMVRMPTDAA